MTTEINNQDNAPVKNQKEEEKETGTPSTEEPAKPSETVDTVGAAETGTAKPSETADTMEAAKTDTVKPSETADAAKAAETDAVKTSETADAAKAAKTDTVKPSETADAAKAAKTDTVKTSETADAAKAAETDAVKTSETASEKEKSVKKTKESPGRKPGAGEEPKRERSQSEGYQRRDSSQRFPKFRRKVCYFCMNKDAEIDYKDANTLGRFITDRGKILPRRVTGVCARHQRGLANAIKKARIIALIPFLEK